ncbi:MAG: DNA methyltransferase [Planctomycetota bacterium]
MPLTTKPLFKRPEISEQFDPAGKIVLHCGDTVRFIESIPDKTIKLIITSPPYNLGKVYENKSGIDAYLECQKQAIEQMVRVLRDDGSICWQVGNFVENAEVFPLDILFYDIFKKHALKMRPLGKPIFEPTGREKISQIPVEWQKEMATVHENC